MEFGDEQMNFDDQEFLDDFETMYHDMYSIEDYRNLARMVKTMPDISK